MANLREQLIAFARTLAAEQWYSSPSYDRTVDDAVGEAKAETKAEIGCALLLALEADVNEKRSGLCKSPSNFDSLHADISVKGIIRCIYCDEPE